MQPNVWMVKLEHKEIIMDFYNIREKFLLEYSNCPTDYKLLNKLALVNMELNEYTKALELFKKAASSSDSVQALSNLGHFYICEGDFIEDKWVDALEDGINLLQKALKLNPVSHLPYSALGEALLKKGSFIEAIGILKQGKNIKATAANCNNLGAALYELGKYYEAAINFLEAHNHRERSNYSFIPYLNYGISMARLGQVEEAERAAEHLMNSEEAEELREFYLIDIAKIFCFTENYLRAAQIFKEAFQESAAEPTEFSIYIYTLKCIGRLNEAEKVLNNSIEYVKQQLLELQNERDVDENTCLYRKKLEEDIQQFLSVYKLVLQGEKPDFEYVPQTEHECCFFGCFGHKNPDE